MKINEFPILKRKISGQRLVYLDNAATTQKPKQVIKAVTDFYTLHNANPERGLHSLAQEATKMLNQSRVAVRDFISAKSTDEIIFTKGATESINLVAATWGEQNIKAGDEIVLTEMEHHSNLVPWQVLAKKKRAKIKYLPMNRHGKLDTKQFDKIITRKTKLVCVVHVSNFLGTINPIKQLASLAHKKGAKILVDAAQSAGRIKIDVSKDKIDFLAISGHKIYGPSGIGILYGQKNLLEEIPPYQTGGGMVTYVDFQNAEYKNPPEKFEAGTLPIAQIAGLYQAIKFINQITINKIDDHEQKLVEYAVPELKKISGLTIYGPKKRGPIISFSLKGVPAHDLASILDKHGVAVRTGHHCTMPAHQKLKLQATVRVSLAIYNSQKDITTLIKGIKDAKRTFGIQ